MSTQGKKFCARLAIVLQEKGHFPGKTSVQVLQESCPFAQVGLVKLERIMQDLHYKMKDIFHARILLHRWSCKTCTFSWVPGTRMLPIPKLDDFNSEMHFVS